MRWTIATSPRGEIRWRFPVWRAHLVTFTGDDRTVIVQAQGGVLALDSATGKPVGLGCGWNFGSFDEPFAQATSGVTPLCEQEDSL